MIPSQEDRCAGVRECRLRVSWIVALLLLASPVAHGAEDEPPASETISGWEETGLDTPALRWRAGVSALVAVSDRFGGRERPGWFTQLAPRLTAERPPARWTGWLSYEPTLLTRNPGGEVAGSAWTLSHQGAAGLLVGDATGGRFSMEAGQRYSLDVVHAEQQGTAEHLESRLGATTGYAIPERGSVGLSVTGTLVRFPDRLLRAADHRRVDGSLQLNADLRSRVTASLRADGDLTVYPDPPEGGERRVERSALLATVAAELTPAVSVRAGGGPTWRNDRGSAGPTSIPLETEERTIALRGWAGITVVPGERLQAALDASTDVQDSLWRGNRRVRVSRLDGRFSGRVRDDVSLSALFGATMLAYPVPEQAEGSQPPIARRDRILTAGAEIAAHPGQRLQTAVSYTRASRESTFPGMSWGENRWIVSALLTW